MDPGTNMFITYCTFMYFQGKSSKPHRPTAPPLPVQQGSTPLLQEFLSQSLEILIPCLGPKLWQIWAPHGSASGNWKLKYVEIMFAIWQIRIWTDFLGKTLTTMCKTEVSDICPATLTYLDMQYSLGVRSSNCTTLSSCSVGPLMNHSVLR